MSKVTGADDEISPTLPWPKHDLQRLQVDNQQSSHLGGRTQRPFESKTDDSKFDIADSRPRVLAPIGSKRREFDEETAKDLKGLLPSSQPDPKCGQLGLIKPHAEGRAPSAPWADLCSQPSPARLDTKAHYMQVKNFCPNSLPLKALLVKESLILKAMTTSRYNTRVTLGCILLRKMSCLLVPRHAALPRVDVRVEA